MTDKLEIQGKTVDEAVSEALLKMGLRRDEVDVTVLEEPKAGFLGLVGNRPARVIVRRRRTGARRRRGEFLNNDADHQAHDLGGDTSRGGRGRSRRGRSAARAGDAEPTRESGGSGRGSGGGTRGDDTRRDDTRRDDRGRGRGGRSGRGGQRRPAAETGERDEIKAGAANGNAAPRNDGQEREEGRSSGRRRRGRRGGRGRSSANRDKSPQDAANGNAVTENTTPPQAAAPEATGGERGRDERPRRSRSRGGRGGGRRDERGAPDSAPANGTTAPETPAVNEAAPAPSPRPNPRPAATTAEDEPFAVGIKALSYAQPKAGVTEDSLDADLAELAGGLLVRAGFPCRCEVKPGEYRLVKIVTDDTSAGMLIGRHGQTIDAVEHLVERVASTAAGDRVRMNLDINNYRRRRQDALVERVAQAVSQVQASGEDCHLEPMDARERRICHLEAALTEGLRTWTVSGPGGKHVVIGIDDGTHDAEDDEPVEIAQNDAGPDESSPVAAAEDAAEDATEDEPDTERSGADV